ncbi:tail fiber domain-containing protein [Diaphorobacter sp. HDW4A]|uniref:tail fiber domain-containing protein n=1 Tax=Diaphorobacter sp. HDW4A TaxID=2714924 RepID=UPI00140E390F|nr:tail fiber domain-containing protein [Diaphorobacter sp. HDW4A]QIL80815.1 tail fiber domain-containing protein [Diaphorobacter sp. HDW4A]QIL83588.1 tail fiber domain-containing protein [Diaphorobacter sp. HDW4A]
MANEITGHYGLPLPDPAAFLEYDVFKLRDAISGIDSLMHQAALNLAQRAQELDALIEQRANALAQSKLDVTATVGVENGGTGAKTVSGARAILSVPSRTGSDASGNWPINITGSAASATDPNAMPKAGGAFTGSITTASNVGAVTGAGGSKLQAMGDASNAAMISFHRASAYAINFGLDTDNAIRIGGWSQGTGVARWTLDASGNMTSSSNVTAYSDARLKTNVVPVLNALARIRDLRGVYFTRIDDPAKARQMGVIAQEVREVFPEVVLESKPCADSEATILTVAYGNLVAPLIEAVKELDREVQALKGARA